MNLGPTGEDLRQAMIKGDYGRPWLLCERKREQFGEYTLLVGRFVGYEGPWPYTSVAKKAPFVYGGHPLKEPDDLWFEFGDTPAEAITRLKLSLSH
jgi:hypothetical protein